MTDERGMRTDAQKEATRKKKKKYIGISGKFQPTREDIEKEVRDFLDNGGVVKKLSAIDRTDEVVTVKQTYPQSSYYNVVKNLA